MPTQMMGRNFPVFLIKRPDAMETVPREMTKGRT